MFLILMQGFYLIGIYIVSFLLILKLGVLLSYKPKDYEYIAKRLLIYHHAYVVRREDFSRWGQFRVILNSITFCLHLSLLFWGMSQHYHR